MTYFKRLSLIALMLLAGAAAAQGSPSCSFADPELKLEALAHDHFAGDSQWWQIYESSFPELERAPNAKLIADYASHGGQSLRLVKGQATIAIAYVYTLKNLPASYLTYIAVDGTARNQGLGTQLFRCVAAEAAERVEAIHRTPSLGMIWELELPDEAQDAAEKSVRARRIAFYQRLGGQILVPSYPAPMRDGTTAPLALMVWDAAQGAAPANAKAKLSALGPKEIYRIWEFSTAYRVPGEFEPMASIWLTSPTTPYIRGWSTLATQAEMVAALLRGDQRVSYGVNGAEDSAALQRALQAKGLSAEQIAKGVAFHPVPHADFWVRDTGGTFKVNAKGDYEAVKLGFDAYRMKAYLKPEAYADYELDGASSRAIAAAKGAKLRESALIAEGGNLHFNGRGTLIAIKKTLLASNPQWSLAEIEAELKRIFDLKKVIFLNRSAGTDSHPVLESPLSYKGEQLFNMGVWHADELVAWVNPTTVLLPQVDPSELLERNPYTLLNHQAFEDAYQVLSQATDQDGKPLTIIRTVDPDPIVVEIGPDDVIYTALRDLKGIRDFPQDGAPVKYVLPASYMNYVVGNEVVLVPQYYKPGRSLGLRQKDKAFKTLIASLYPGRQVVAIAVDSLNAGGGGMHCISQQVPY